jgi:putative hydrolase of the HAD superfamily
MISNQSVYTFDSVESIGGIVFDFYGTLVEENSDEIRSDQEIFRSYGYELSETMRRHWIDPVTSLEHVEVSSDRATYSEWQRGLWRRSLRECGIADNDLESLVDHAVSRSREREFSAISGTIETLRTIRNAGIRTAVCSNWGWDLTEAVDACGLTGLFEVIVSSAQAGYRKPHGAIFNTVLERLGLEAGAVLFVGDTWSADIAGALSAGLWAAQIVHEDDRREQVAPPSRVTRIRVLRELIPLVAVRD